jgi:hypothetical protein
MEGQQVYVLGFSAAFVVSLFSSTTNAARED